MTDLRSRHPGLPSPGRLLKQSVFMYVFIHITGIFIIAAADAERNFYYFRFFALGLIWASASIVVSTFLSTRRVWQGQPPADIKDGIVPAAVIFALGWAIWTLAHL